jgi:hypothetical protein
LRVGCATIGGLCVGLSPALSLHLSTIETNDWIVAGLSADRYHLALSKVVGLFLGQVGDSDVRSCPSLVLLISLALTGCGIAQRWTLQLSVAAFDWLARRAVRLRRRFFTIRIVIIATALALAGGVVCAQTTAGDDSSAGPIAAQTAMHDPPPSSFVAAVESEAADVDATIVKPCKNKKEKIIGAERQREESCSECQAQLAQLAIVERQALARCDVEGYDARIADLDARTGKVIAQLQNLVLKFKQQAQSDEDLSEEIKKGETEAEATFTEAAVGKVMDWVLNLPPDKQIALIEAAEERLKDVKDVRRVTKGELGAFVLEMKAELAGKSKAQARAIIVTKLENAKLLADGIKGINVASGQIASHNIDKIMGTRPDVTGELLDSAYGALVTGLQITAGQSAEKLKLLIASSHVLGYGLDAVKIGAVFANLSQLQQNVDGLSSLTQAAESQRKIAKSEIDYLVQKRRVLVEQRNKSQRVADAP